MTSCLLAVNPLVPGAERSQMGRSTAAGWPTWSGDQPC